VNKVAVMSLLEEVDLGNLLRKPTKELNKPNPKKTLASQKSKKTMTHILKVTRE